jgi:hypothetical protein
VRVFQVDFGFVLVIGLITEDGGVLRVVFGDELTGVDGGLVRDSIIDVVVSALRVPFLGVDLDLEIMLESMFEGVFVTTGVLRSASKVDAVCSLQWEI